MEEAKVSKTWFLASENSQKSSRRWRNTSCNKMRVEWEKRSHFVMWKCRGQRYFLQSEHAFSRWRCPWQRGQKWFFSCKKQAYVHVYTECIHTRGTETNKILWRELAIRGKSQNRPLGEQGWKDDGGTDSEQETRDVVCKGEWKALGTDQTFSL